MGNLVRVGSVLTIIAGVAILAWVIGIFAVRAGRRVPWLVNLARRTRSAVLESSTPVTSRVEAWFSAASRRHNA